MIRKGQARWVAGDDLLRQIQFIDSLFAFGSLRTHDRRSATNLSAFETCNTTVKTPDEHAIEPALAGIIHQPIQCRAALARAGVSVVDILGYFLR